MRDTRPPLIDPFGTPSHIDRLALHARQEISHQFGETSDLFDDSYVYVGVNENDIRARLQALGQEPIDEQTRTAHMQRIAAGRAVVSEPRRRGLVWAGIAAAAVVGFLAGSAGLAMADALPNPAQEVAHDVLGAVQVDVPAGKEGKRGPCVAEAAKLKDKDAKKAAMDACPKGGERPDDSDDPKSDGAPGKSGEAPGHRSDAPGKSGQAPGQTKHASDPCHGRPPWAGKMSKQERDAAKQAASREACPPDADDDGASIEDTEAETSDEAND